MFRAVRAWWGIREWRRPLRLFVFEFVVVVAGVLVAQALAGWVQSRGDQAEGQRLLADVTAEALTLQRDLNFWHRFGPCLREHVVTISRTAAEGGTMTDRQIGRPALPGIALRQFSADDWRKMRSVAPTDRADALLMLSGAAATYNDFIADTAHQWPTLRLIDVAMGPASSEDRSRVRLAAATIDNNLRWMMFQHATNIGGAVQRAGLASSSGLSKSSELVDQCGLLKDWR